MNKPRCLDLFSGAGGAGMGLYRAGFDVVGVDIKPQPRYPFEFIQADALTFDLSGFDFIWASPPCEDGSKASASSRIKGWRGVDLIPPTRTMLQASGLPYIIENVEGSSLQRVVKLCGLNFGLKVYRHRYFESNLALLTPSHIKHREHIGENGFVCVVNGRSNSNKNPRGSMESWQVAMDIDWMNRAELTKAIPPAFSEYLGKQIINYLERIKLAA